MFKVLQKIPKGVFINNEYFLSKNKIDVYDRKNN